jgi:hypothetical protein
MSRLLLAICLLAFISSLSAQNHRSSLSGIVADPNGTPLDGAPIQLKNKTTGVVARTTSEPGGHYTFAPLPAGTYELTIVMPCCAFARVKRDITLETGKTAELNIALRQTINGSTLGDDPGTLAAAMAKRAKIPSRPVARISGHPDLSGVWVAIDDPYPEEPQLLPRAAAVVKQRAEDLGRDAPHNHCLPGPPPVPGSSAPFIAKFVQTPSLLVILFEDTPGFRQVFLDGRGHPTNWDPSWMGHSLGKWEGDVLVVDSVGFNDRSWIGGIGTGNLPHTEKLRLTERYRRVDFGHMEAAVTFDDPATFLKPLKMNAKFNLVPQEELLEYVCENNHPEHQVGK